VAKCGQAVAGFYLSCPDGLAQGVCNLLISGRSALRLNCAMVKSVDIVLILLSCIIRGRAQAPCHSPLAQTIKIC